MVLKKRRSIIYLLVFQMFMTTLFAGLFIGLFADIRADRLNTIRTDSYILGEWIRDSYTASAYLLKSLISLFPSEQIFYPPRDVRIYSDLREKINVLSTSFPHSYLIGIIDDSGILTHSLYHDGRDMTRYEFYRELREKPAGSFLLSDAFQIEEGEWVVCHALKYDDPERDIIAVLMISLDFFEDWLSRQDHEYAEQVVLLDRGGHTLSGSGNGFSELNKSSLLSLLSSDGSEENTFLRIKGRDGNLILRRISGLPYSVVFINPVLGSFSEYLIPVLVFIIFYALATVLGILVFRSQVAQINLYLELEETSSEMTAVFENAMVGIVKIDERNRISRANIFFAKLFAYESIQDVEGEPLSRFFASDKGFCKLVEQYKDDSGKDMTFKTDCELLRKDGVPIWVSIVGKPLHKLVQRDSFTEAIWIIEDISERRSVEKKMKALAATDPLTGIANRRHFMEKGEREFAIFLRHKRPLTAVMMDLDHFKAVNDTYGHAVGDRSLILAVDICRKNLRAGDLFGRYGGEEFVFLFPDTGEEEAYGVADRIRSMIETETRNRTDGIPPLTVSMGVSAAGEDDRLDTLLQKADEALYKAKGTGRNRVCRL